MLDRIEVLLGELLSETRPENLFQAMRHAVMPGGKRIRPQLCLAAAKAVGGKAEDAIYPACAIELLHSYTLVHDDLPAMDGDTMRRGRPSVWAKFGETTALLAGDALQALAFDTATRVPRNAGRILAALGHAATGVVLGQAEEFNAKKTDDSIDFIYRHKTADLFIAAATMGAYAGGGTDADVRQLETYALNLGMAFQHEDDLLDGNSPFAKDETERRISDHTAAAVTALDGLPGDISPLISLAEHLAKRRN